MTARYAQRTGRQVDGLRELTALAAAGDEIATETVRTAMTALGAALAPWLVGFRPDVVVFGGSITAAWPIVGPPLLAALGVDTVVVLPDGEAAALLGAATHAATGADPAAVLASPV
jgi:glucokinase